MAEAEADGARLTLAAHLRSARFCAGVEEGRWAILRDAFPELVVRVTGEDMTGRTRVSMVFQLVCDGFPAQAPFIQQWDMATGRRPAPPTAQEAPPGVVDALKQWNETPAVPYGGLYRPWQRHAAVHNGWAAKRPDEAWRRDRHLTFIMERLYGLASEQAAWQTSLAAA